MAYCNYNCIEISLKVFANFWTKANTNLLTLVMMRECSKGCASISFFYDIYFLIIPEKQKKGVASRPHPPILTPLK